MAETLELLAEKYLKNRCTPEEAALVLDWFHTETGRTFLENQLEEDNRLLENDNLFISPVNIPSSGMLKTILNATANLHTGNSPKELAKIIEPDLTIVPVSHPLFKRWYMVAALVMGIALSIIISYNYFSRGTISHNTKYGEIARIILPDSSSVTLNGNSRIEYAANWELNETRIVKLDGEAFFSVKHKTNNQKFIVSIADTIRIEVLGTEFNVSGRKRQTQVVLVSGKIRLDMQGRQDKTSVIMNPGESIEIKPVSYVLHKEVVDPSVITSWTGNKLIFDNTSVREICERLKDTYGYQIVVTDQKILNQHITGSVPNQSIDMVLQGLEAILDTKFTKKTN